MAEQRAGIGTGVTKRRGLLAGAAAVVAGGLARLAGPGRAEAAHNSTTDYTPESVLHADFVNTTASATIIKSDTGFTPFMVQNTTADTPVGPCGIFAATSRENSGGQQGAGVFGLGTGNSGTGAAGLAQATNGIGVYGAAANKFITQSGPGGSGVFGFGPTNGVAGRAGGGGTGVRGESPNGAGVYGTSTSGVGSIGISREAAGLYGLSTNSVGAYATSPNDAGLYGEGTRNAGVFGASPVYGVWGRTNAGFGVNGEAAGAGIGVYGKAGAGGFAGYFDGPVFIRGVGVLGSSAAPEATAAQAASAQTVESFGEAQLVNGAASITVDQETVAAIEGGTYQVFLTPYGQHKALVVTRRGPSGFDVRAEGAPAESGSFGWRVVAKAKPAAHQAANADTTPRIVMPKDVPVPTAPELPTPGASRPERPAVPDAR